MFCINHAYIRALMLHFFYRENESWCFNKYIINLCSVHLKRKIIQSEIKFRTLTLTVTLIFIRLSQRFFCFQ